MTKLHLMMLVLVAALPGCSDQKSQAKVQERSVEESFLRFEGRLDDAAATKIEQSLSDQTKVLSINSRGGRQIAATRIANAINARGIALQVDGLCLSACAHFLFLPAATRSLTEGSLVAFHQTSTALDSWLKASGRDDLAAPFAAMASLEQKAFAEAAVDDLALTAPYAAIEPVCFVEDLSKPAGSEYRASVGSRYTFYVPTRAEVERWSGGRRVSGYWPRTSADMNSALERFGRGMNATFKMALTGAPAMPGPQTTRALERC